MTEGIAALPTYDADRRLLAVIEAPRGSANKLKFDPGAGVFVLHKVLPPGSVFPFDFGFVPGTLGEDGDPLDVLVPMDEPAAPGVVVPCRLLGGSRRRSAPSRTRALRAACATTAWSPWPTRRIAMRPAARCSLRDVGNGLLDEIEAFFVFYNARFDKRFTPLRRAGIAAARQLVAEGRTTFAANH